MTHSAPPQHTRLAPCCSAARPCLAV
jgi:hypothetical protein